MSNEDKPNNSSDEGQLPPDQDVQSRFEQNQRRVADQERANRIKAQSLIQREQKLEDEMRLIEQERKMLSQTQQSLKMNRQRRTAFMLPLLLVAAIAAGLLAFYNIEQQNKYFSQVTTASKNIDTLARILSNTQDEVVLATSRLSNKQIELERTKTMLSDLKSTTDQLQMEIRQLKGDTSESAEGKTALTQSAGNLVEQLALLNAQLEDHYLNEDINEAFIEYQENDLKRAEQRLKQQAELLEDQAHQIASLKANISKSDSSQP